MRRLTLDAPPCGSIGEDHLLWPMTLCVLMSFLSALSDQLSRSMQRISDCALRKAATTTLIVTAETASRIKRWVGPCLLAAAITGASSCSRVAAPAITHIDKLAHFAVFGLLATLVYRAGGANANDPSQSGQGHGRDARATRHVGQEWQGRLAHVWEYLDAKEGWSKWPAWLAVLIVSAFGVTDEWHQSFVPGRDADVFDWLSDTLGAALAVVLYVRWGWYRRLLEIRLGTKRQIENPRATASLSSP